MRQRRGYGTRISSRAQTAQEFVGVFHYTLDPLPPGGIGGAPVKVKDLTQEDVDKVFVLERASIVALDNGGVLRYRIYSQAVIVPAVDEDPKQAEVLGKYESANGSVGAHFFVRRCGDGTIPLGAWVVIK